MASPIILPVRFNEQEAQASLGRLDASVDRLAASVDNAGNQFAAAARQSSRFSREAATSLSRARREATGLGNQLRSIRRIVAGGLFGFGLIQATQGFASLVDSGINLESQLRQVTDTSIELRDVNQQIYDLATELRAPVQGLGILFARTARSVGDAFDNDEILQFTRTVTQLGIASGASGQEFRAATIQLAQGLASARLQGEELRSVLEQLPEVARAIARSFGITYGDLRRAASEGVLTGEGIVRGLISQDEVARAEAAFANVELTFGRVFDNFINRLQAAFAAPDSDTREGTGNLLVRLDDGLTNLVPYIEKLANAILDLANSPLFSLSGLATLAAFGAIGGGTSFFQRARANTIAAEAFNLRARAAHTEFLKPYYARYGVNRVEDLLDAGMTSAEYEYVLKRGNVLAAQENRTRPFYQRAGSFISNLPANSASGLRAVGGAVGGAAPTIGAATAWIAGGAAVAYGFLQAIRRDIDKGVLSIDIPDTADIADALGFDEFAENLRAAETALEKNRKANEAAAGGEQITEGRSTGRIITPGFESRDDFLKQLEREAQDRELLRRHEFFRSVTAPAEADVLIRTLTAEPPWVEEAREAAAILEDSFRYQQGLFNEARRSTEGDRVDNLLGRDTVDGFVGIGRLISDFEDHNEEVAARVADAWRESAREIGSSFRNVFEDIKSGTFDLTSTLSETVRLLLQIQANRENALGIVPSTAQSVVRGFFGVFHEGRWPTNFSDTREIPAVIRANEAVLTPSQLRSLQGGRAGATVNMYNQFVGSVDDIVLEVVNRQARKIKAIVSEVR